MRSYPEKNFKCPKQECDQADQKGIASKSVWLMLYAFPNTQFDRNMAKRRQEHYRYPRTDERNPLACPILVENTWETLIAKPKMPTVPAKPIQPASMVLLVILSVAVPCIFFT